MPHITFETTRLLWSMLPFDSIMLDIHRQIADLGHARLSDFKSRVLVSEHSLAGDRRDGEFVVARLTMTNPRSDEVQHEMALVVHDIVRKAIENLAPPFWWQCCVFIENFDKHNYVKTDSRERGQ